jgi:hypothetical protein
MRLDLYCFLLSCSVGWLRSEAVESTTKRLLVLEVALNKFLDHQLLEGRGVSCVGPVEAWLVEDEPGHVVARDERRDETVRDPVINVVRLCSNDEEAHIIRHSVNLRRPPLGETSLDIMEEGDYRIALDESRVLVRPRTDIFLGHVREIERRVGSVHEAMHSHLLAMLNEAGVLEPRSLRKLDTSATCQELIDGVLVVDRDVVDLPRTRSAEARSAAVADDRELLVVEENVHAAEVIEVIAVMAKHELIRNQFIVPDVTSDLREIDHFIDHLVVTPSTRNFHQSVDTTAELVGLDENVLGRPNLELNLFNGEQVCDVIDHEKIVIDLPVKNVLDGRQTDGTAVLFEEYVQQARGVRVAGADNRKVLLFRRDQDEEPLRDVLLEEHRHPDVLGNLRRVPHHVDLELFQLRLRQAEGFERPVVALDKVRLRNGQETTVDKVVLDQFLHGDPLLRPKPNP